MSKKTILAAFVAMASAQAFAGGLLTNTNQNAAFLRNMSQDGQITLTSIYANPAGNVFLSEGWHISLNSQTAVQQRNITTTFPYFAYNTQTPGQSTHKFKGEAFAPIIPSVSASYNKERWSVSMHFALGGGGGKCEFNDGIGSFEALYSNTVMNAAARIGQGVSQQLQAAPYSIPATYADMIGATTQVTGYSMDSYMKGRSYYFGLQLGGAYKFTDNLAGFIGVRGVYATCNYNGYVQDVKAQYNVPANAALGFPGASGTADLDAYNLSLNCDQSGIGFTPIIGIDYRLSDQFNFAAKYEAPTKMNLKNSSEMNNFAQAQAATPGNTLAQFRDGSKVREDIPGILALGAQYSPVEKVRINAGFHEYFDKSAKKYNDKQDLIDHNTWELNAGVEYDCCKLVTVSASWQTTQYGLSDEYMNDLSFNNSNHMVGFGVRLHPNKHFNIDLGYMHTIYQDRTVVSAGGAKKDLYQRKNDVVGIGFNFAL